MKNTYVVLTAILLWFACVKMVYSQSNFSVATAKSISSFPHVEKDVNSEGGGSASGMQGACHTLACCSVLVYKVTVPSYGSLRIDNANFTPLAGSAIAYTPNVPNPTDWSDLTYFSDVGNFCGYRDSMQLGYGYSWSTENWTSSDINKAIAPGDYYVLLWNVNNQTSQGTGTKSDFTFRFVPFCPDGYRCSIASETLCSGEGYVSPSGKIYTSSGNYTDTLLGVAEAGRDSLIFTNLTINHKKITQDILTKDSLCSGKDTLKHFAKTKYASYASFSKTKKNWVEINDVRTNLENTNRSVFMWMRQSAKVSGESQVLLAINTSSGGNISNLQITTDEQLSIYEGSNSIKSGTTVTDGAWHFVGYTYNEVTGETVMYVDGKPVKTFSNSQRVESTSLISLGQEFDNSSMSNYFEGEMTEVSIWNEILDSAEVSKIMMKPVRSNHTKYNNLVAYYPMITNCDGDHTIVKDFSGKGKNGKASHSTIQKTDDLTEITGFNGSFHFMKKWWANEKEVSIADSLFLTTYEEGNYQLKLYRDFFTITDDWLVKLNPTCVCAKTTNTISPVACYSYVSPSGKHTWTTSDTYVDTIPNSCGSDSIITVNLTINKVDVSVSQNLPTLTANEAGATYQWVDCGNNFAVLNNETQQSFTAMESGNYAVIVSKNSCLDTSECVAVKVCLKTTSTISPVACYSYVSPSGKHTWTTSDTYVDTIPNSCGSDSIITVNLTINKVDVSVSQNLPTLTANEAGATYQWVDCGNNFAVLNNETQQSFTALESGNYGVIVSKNSCVDTSSCNKVVISSLLDEKGSFKISVSPNPTNKEVKINLGKGYNGDILKIRNVAGQVISEIKANAPIMEIALQGIKGVYLLEVHHENGKIEIFKLVKK